MKSQPRSSRSWRASELRDGARVVGALLDERQRLKHRVVDVRGHLGALLRADPLSALGGEVAAEAPPERRQDEPEGQDHDHDREDRVAERIEGARERKDDERRPADEGCAEAATVDVAEAVALRSGRAWLDGGGEGLGNGRRRDLGLARPAPQERDPGRREEQRHDGAEETEREVDRAVLVEQEHGPGRNQTEAGSE